jgi:hypothetical protein
MDILFNLFEFYNLGFFVSFLFLNSISDTFRHIYSTLYILINVFFDKDLSNLEENGTGYEKCCKWILNLILTTIGLFTCDTLTRDIIVFRNLVNFHFSVFLLCVLHSISQIYNGEKTITTRAIHLYLQLMLVIAIFSVLI